MIHLITVTMIPGLGRSEVVIIYPYIYIYVYIYILYLIQLPRLKPPVMLPKKVPQPAELPKNPHDLATKAEGL